MTPGTRLQRARLAVAGTFLAAVMGMATPAYGNVYTFFSSGTTSGGPVSAQATFVTSATNVIITLTNLLANPTDVAQLISDINFTASGVTGGGGAVTPSGTYVSIANHTASAASAPTTASWQLVNTSGSNYHLTAIGCSISCVGPQGLVIGPGPYTNANGSINGNGAHNPFMNQTATFTLALANIASISNVAFSFGTTAGVDILPGVPAVPIPAAVWLFVSGLLGLIGIARRKHTFAH